MTSGYYSQRSSPRHNPPAGLSLTQDVFSCHSCRDFKALKIQPSILWLKVLTSSARFQADVVACESEMANAIF